VKNSFIVILIIVIGVITYKFITNSNNYKQELQKVNKKIDSLEIVNTDLYRISDSLSSIEPEIITEYIRIYEQLEKQEDETDKIVDIVSGYNEQQLDSILTNHRHIKRTKARDSIND
jgi:uncharacterized membrane protein